MRVAESFTQIRSIWLSRVSHSLARGEELRENFRQSLDQFFQLLEQAVLTGDPAWLDKVLEEWVNSRTQTDLERGETSLLPILNQMLLITFEVVREVLPTEESLNLILAILPAFTYASEFATQRETTMYVEHIARQLEKANATLERLDRSKSDFIAIAAHELKTPLTLIEGYASMLRDQLPKHPDLEHTYILLKGVDNGTGRLREIVDDMIDVSLIDNSLLTLNFQPVWLNRIFRVLQEEFKGVVSARGQILSVQEFDGYDEMTFGDEERLFQAFRNLISNAIKYTPDGGKIIVDGRQLPGFIEVTVEDSGIGIDVDDHTRIFEKFGRLGSVALHSSGKTKYKGGGPGLGLPITKGIIEAHGGSVWVESPGFDERNCPGSIFHIMLPLRKTPPDDKAAKLFRPLSESDVEIV
jgi:signal transduction histidine kinase